MTSEVAREQQKFIQEHCPDRNPKCKECRWEFSEELAEIEEALEKS